MDLNLTTIVDYRNKYIKQDTSWTTVNLIDFIKDKLKTNKLIIPESNIFNYWYVVKSQNTDQILNFNTGLLYSPVRNSVYALFNDDGNFNFSINLNDYDPDILEFGIDGNIHDPDDACYFVYNENTNKFYLYEYSTYQAEEFHYIIQLIKLQYDNGSWVVSDVSNFNSKELSYLLSTNKYITDDSLYSSLILLYKNIQSKWFDVQLLRKEYEAIQFLHKNEKIDVTQSDVNLELNEINEYSKFFGIDDVLTDIDIRKNIDPYNENSLHGNKLPKYIINNLVYTDKQVYELDLEKLFIQGYRLHKLELNVKKALTNKLPRYTNVFIAMEQDGNFVFDNISIMYTSYNIIDLSSQYKNVKNIKFRIIGLTYFGEYELIENDILNNQIIEISMQYGNVNQTQ